MKLLTIRTVFSKPVFLESRSTEMGRGSLYHLLYRADQAIKELERESRNIKVALKNCGRRRLVIKRMDWRKRQYDETEVTVSILLQMILDFYLNLEATFERDDSDGKVLKRLAHLAMLTLIEDFCYRYPCHDIVTASEVEERVFLVRRKLSTLR